MSPTLDIQSTSKKAQEHERKRKGCARCGAVARTAPLHADAGFSRKGRRKRAREDGAKRGCCGQRAHILATSAESGETRSPERGCALSSASTKALGRGEALSADAPHEARTHLPASRAKPYARMRRTVVLVRCNRGGQSPTRADAPPGTPRECAHGSRACTPASSRCRHARESPV